MKLSKLLIGSVIKGTEPHQERDGEKRLVDLQSAMTYKMTIWNNSKERKFFHSDKGLCQLKLYI